MLSVRARMINGVLRLVRLAGFEKKLQEAAGDPEAEAVLIARARRGDTPEPPRRLVQNRAHHRLTVDTTPLHVIAHGRTPHHRVMLYLHGGGYFVGPTRAHWATGLVLSDELGCDFALPDYPKAPEHRAPEIIASAEAVYDTMLERYGAENIVVAGDSAGGGLTLALLARLRDTGRPQPRCAVLISPWLDLTLTAPGIDDELLRRDLMLSVTGGRRAGEWYAGDLDPADPLLSPVHTDPEGLAPLHLWVGTHEIFLPDCRTFAGKARANGHRVTIQEMRKGQHVAPLFPTPEARIARGQMVALIDWP